MSAGTSPSCNALRPYQREARGAIVGSVLGGAAVSFSVEIARQGGKNELSARIELLLLALHLDRDVTSIKAAPTLQPQALISLQPPLGARAATPASTRWAAQENGNCVRLGRARQLFLSAEPSSNIVGHTADLLLEIDEAQDVDIDKFDKELRPMAASTGATTVFYGTAWDDANLLERAKQAHLEAERRDGVRRHFEYDWQVVAARNPAYERFVVGERERLGADHPLFLTPVLPAARCPAPDACSARRSSRCCTARTRASMRRVAGETYVAGLDVAGEAVEAGGEAGHDATVLTIGARAGAGRGGRWRRAAIEVVRHYAWTGARARRAATARSSRCCARPGACSASPWTRPASASRWRRS